MALRVFNDTGLWACLRGFKAACSRRERYLADATIVLYDGSPFRPFDAEGGKGEMAMPRLIEELQIPLAKPDTSQCHIIQVVVVK
jgi:hypothetical protein